jgi:hypothetical protein
MTDQEARVMPVKLDFLKSGQWSLRLWRDSSDSGTDAEHLGTEYRTVTSGDVLSLHLAPNGGAVARLVPKEDDKEAFTRY